MTTQRPPIAFSFRRSMRLRTMRDFGRPRQEGQRLAKGSIVANWLPIQANSSTRLGVITSRKLGKAHTRTRARRLMREAFRLHQHDLRHPVDLVLIARSSIVGKKFMDVERDLLAVLRQANLLKKTN